MCGIFGQVASKKIDVNRLKKLGVNGEKWIYSNRKYSTLAKEYIVAIEKLWLKD